MHRPSSIASPKEILGSGRYQSKRGEASSHRRSIAVRRDIKLSFKHHGSFKEYLIDVCSVWWFYLVIIVALSEFFFVLYDVQTAPLLFFTLVFGLAPLALLPAS